MGMLLGATVTAGVDAGLEIYYNVTPGMTNQFPYISVHPAIPSVDDWVACVGTPLALYALSKVLKKPLLKNMAKGGAVYGFSEIVGQTIYRVAKVAQGQSLGYRIVR